LIVEVFLFPLFKHCRSLCEVLTLPPLPPSLLPRPNGAFCAPFPTGTKLQSPGDHSLHAFSPFLFISKKKSPGCARTGHSFFPFPLLPFTRCTRSRSSFFFSHLLRPFHFFYRCPADASFPKETRSTDFSLPVGPLKGNVSRFFFFSRGRSSHFVRSFRRRLPHLNFSFGCQGHSHSLRLLRRFFFRILLRRASPSRWQSTFLVFSNVLSPLRGPMLL